MIKTMLTIAAVTLTAVPTFAETVTSPLSTPKSVSFSAGLGDTGSMPPTMALYESNITNNIACRNAARSKFFELGARDMSPSDSNSQWATISNMKAIVWCRENRAIIAVAGYNYNSVAEVRDVISKGF